MKTNNTFKRIAAGAIATVSVAANAMQANVGGVVVDGVNAMLAAHADDVVVKYKLDIATNSVKQYLEKVKVVSPTGTTSEATNFELFNAFDIEQNSTVTIESNVKLKDDCFTAGTNVEAKPTVNFVDGKWVYTFKQTGAITLNTQGVDPFEFDGANNIDDANPALTIYDKILTIKVGKGGTGKEWSKTATGATAGTAKELLNSAIDGETIEITSNDLLDFKVLNSGDSSPYLGGTIGYGKDAAPERTVAPNGVFTYKLSAAWFENNVKVRISKGIHQHTYSVVGLTSDKTAIEIKCSDTVDGKHTKPTSVFLTLFNFSKVPGDSFNSGTATTDNENHNKTWSVDHPKDKNYLDQNNNVVYSELADTSYVYGQVAFPDMLTTGEGGTGHLLSPNFGLGVYNTDTTEDTTLFWTSATFAAKTDDNVETTQAGILNGVKVGNKSFIVNTPVVYNDKGEDILSVAPATTPEELQANLQEFYKKLNKLPVGSYTVKYKIVNNNAGADIIDEEGSGNEHIGTGDSSTTNTYTIEVPMNIVSAEINERDFSIAVEDDGNVPTGATLTTTNENYAAQPDQDPDFVKNRYWTYEYDHNTRFTPIVKVTDGLTEGTDYIIEGDLSASRVGEYEIHVIGIGNYDFYYTLNWQIVDKYKESVVGSGDDPVAYNDDREFEVVESKTTYGENVFDVVKDKLSYKDEDYVYTYYYKVKDQTDNPKNNNIRDQFTTKEAWEKDLKVNKAYKEITDGLVLPVGEYTITVLATDVNTNVTTRTVHDNFLVINKAQAKIVIGGKYVTFDGKSHIADGQSAEIFATVVDQVKNKNGDIVEESLNINDSHDAFIEAAKKLKVDVKVAANTGLEAAGGFADVIHAGSYKLALNEKSYADFVTIYGKNYNITVDRDSEYTDTVSAEPFETLYVFNDDVAKEKFAQANGINDNYMCKATTDKPDDLASPSYLKTVTGIEGRINPLYVSLKFDTAQYTYNAGDGIGDPKTVTYATVKLYTVDDADYKVLDQATVTKFLKMSKLQAMFGFSPANVFGNIDNTLVILPAKLSVDLQKDTYTYNDTLTTPKYTVYGVDNTVLEEGTDYTVDGARSAQGSDIENTQYYTIINGANDYAFSQDAFNWQIVNNEQLRNAGKVTYSPTTSILKDGKQRVTYTINRELLAAAPKGTTIIDAGLFYYNGLNASDKTASDLINNVGKYLEAADKTNIVKQAHVAKDKLSLNKASLQVNILDNTYGICVLGYIEVQDAEGNTAMIYGEGYKETAEALDNTTVVTKDETHKFVVRPYAYVSSYASANIEAEKAAQAAIDVEILPLTYTKYNDDVKAKPVEYIAQPQAGLAATKGYRFTKNDNKQRVTFEIKRSLDAAAKEASQLNANGNCLNDYDYEITEYGVYYYNGLNDISESALTNQWVGKVPKGQTLNNDTTNVVKQAHVLKSTAAQFNDTGILQVNVSDNGNGVQARGFVCVTLYKKGTLKSDNPEKLYETTIYSAQNADAGVGKENETNKHFDAVKNIEVYTGSVVTRKYNELVNNAINGKIRLKNPSQSNKGDNYQAVMITAQNDEAQYGFKIVEYGVIYSTNAMAVASDLTLDKVDNNNIKKQSVVKEMETGTVGTVTVDTTNGLTNKKYNVYLIVKDAEGNSTVIYPEATANPNGKAFQMTEIFS